MTRDSMPTQAERGELVQRLVSLGYRSQDLANIITAGRPRGQIAADLIAMQREAPKAS